MLQWIEENLVIPDGEHQGEPLVATPEQAIFTIRLYRIIPKRERLYYRGGQLIRPKGWGKSPYVAALSWADAKGPSRFSGWDAAGEPVGRPPATPWVQLAAVAEDQTANTWLSLLAMADDETAPLVHNYPDIDVGLTRINLAGGGRIEYVTSRSGTREGQRTTFAILDETHLWYPHNGGKKLSSTIRRNVAKMNGLAVETTNMYAPGESSVAEETHRAGMGDILVDSGIEAPHLSDLSKKRPLRKALNIAYGDSTRFVDIDRLIAEVNDPRVSPNEARRYYLNQCVTGVDAWMNPETWGKLTADPDELAGDITIGFSGARHSDGAALVGCDIATGHLFTIAAWEASGRDWQLPTRELDAAVDQVFKNHTVSRMYANPMHGIWDSYIDQWIADQGKRIVIRWSISREGPWSHAIASFMAAVKAGDAISHPGDELATRHVLNAHTRPTKRAKDDDGKPMHLIERAHPERSIAWAQAAVLAYEARGDAIAAGAKKRRGKARGF